MGNIKRPSFVYYKDWADELMKLPDDLRLRIDDAVKRYVFYGEEPTDREVLYSMFALMRTQIDRDQAKYDEVKAKRADAGVKGNLKRWGSKSQKVANVANAINASQMSQKVANVAVDVDVDVDVNRLTNVSNKEPSNEGKKGVSRLLSLTERQRIFYDELVPYVGEYSQELVRSFYDYWSEETQAGTKMRRELEKTWDTAKRLARWRRSERPAVAADGGTARKNDAEQRKYEVAAIMQKLLAENKCVRL